MERFNNIRELRGNPNVARVGSDRLVLTVNFRIQLYQAWKERGIAGITETMEKADLGADKVGSAYIESLNAGFKGGGFPTLRPTELEKLGKEINPLVLTGKFVRLTMSGRVRLEPNFKEILYAQYPAVSVTEGLRDAGIDLIDVGSVLIQQVEKEFKKRAEKELIEKVDKGHPVSSPNLSTASETSINHPYIRRIVGKMVTPTESFYNEAFLIRDLGLDKVLEVFEIQPDWIGETSRIQIKSRLCRWAFRRQEAENKEGQALQIYWNREKAMSELVASRFEALKSQMPNLTMQQKRKLCYWIRDLPRDPWGYYTTRRILEKVGIAKSTYYEFLSNENYGRSVERKARKDAEDILLVRRVVEYKGFKKGYRQVYMMMESVTGQRMSMHRVLYLMRLDGIRTTIRRPSKNRKAMRELMERNGHPNLLDRRFTQYRPNQVRLTDVTYLDYGNDLRAYGSASIDPVTGRLICFVVNENNDLQLALDTLDAMDKYPAEKGGIIHSDQGILYFTDDYQNAVKERNLIQSMSRRGNCWDNAPQESFFGHFKDECRYSDCATLAELRCAVQEYGVYYNQDRRMWFRKHMTPVEYEAYLTSMSEEEFAVYLAEEEAAWKARKEKSSQKAAQRGRSYRESVEGAQEDWNHGTHGSSAHV